MKILLYIKAFISGMMGKPALADGRVYFSDGKPQVIKMSMLNDPTCFNPSELERIKPKRKESKVTAGIVFGDAEVPLDFKKPKRKYKKRKAK